MRSLSPTGAVPHGRCPVTLLGVTGAPRAYRMLIGACNPILCFVPDSRLQGDEGDVGEPAARRGVNESPANPGLLKMQAKRLSKKAQFDSQYDSKTAFDEQKEAQAEQAAFNKSEFENEDEYTRVQLEGYRPGLYVRIEIEDVPPELIDNFDPHYPLVLGGLLPSEMAMGYLQMRFKKHRWHKKILKTRDPLVVSLGWRRFQTIPLYACHDRDAR